MQIKRASHAEHHHQMNTIQRQSGSAGKKGDAGGKETDQSLDSLLDVISDSVSDDQGFEINEDPKAPPDFRKWQNAADPDKAERKAKHHHGHGHCRHGDDDDQGQDYQAAGAENAGRPDWAPPPPKAE